MAAGKFFNFYNSLKEKNKDDEHPLLVKLDDSYNDPSNDLIVKDVDDDKAEKNEDSESKKEEQLASDDEIPQTLEEKVLDSIQAVDVQLKLTNRRIDELNAIINDSLAKAKQHAATIPVDYEQKENLAFAIAWLEKKEKLQEKIDRLKNENVDDHRDELIINLQRHDKIGIDGEILTKSKDDGVEYTKLIHIADNWKNSQFDDQSLNWNEQNNAIYSFCFNRKYERDSLNTQSKKLNSIKNKLEKNFLYLEQSGQQPQSDEAEAEIMQNIAIANRYCEASSEAEQANNIVQAAGGELGEAEFGLPLLGSDRKPENLSRTVQTVHALSKTINNDLNRIRALQKGLQANPTSEHLKEEYETLLVSLKKSFTQLDNSLNASEKAKTLILLEQLQNFNLFFNRYHSLRAASFSRYERIFMTKALTQPSTPEDFKKLTKEPELFLFDPHTRKLQPLRDKSGQPLKVSNAVFLEVLDNFVGSVKITHKGNKTQYRFNSQEDLKQFIQLCMEKSLREQKKQQPEQDQNTNKEEFSVRETAAPEAKEHDENNNTQPDELKEKEPLSDAVVREAPEPKEEKSLSEAVVREAPRTPRIR